VLSIEFGGIGVAQAMEAFRLQAVGRVEDLE